MAPGEHNGPNCDSRIPRATGGALFLRTGSRDPRPGRAALAGPARGSLRASDQTSGRHGRRVTRPSPLPSPPTRPARRPSTRCSPAVAASRLLVPVVAVLAEANADGTVPPAPASARSGSGSEPPAPASARSGSGSEKETEMALPTLIGNDGRKAVMAFTGTDTVRRWRADARPVPVPASRLWPAARGRGRPTLSSSTWRARSRWSSRAPACGRSPAARRFALPARGPRRPCPGRRGHRQLHPRTRRPGRRTDRHRENPGPDRRTRRGRGHRGPPSPPPAPRHSVPHQLAVG